MAFKENIKSEINLKYLPNDLSSGLVVFLVALPLCIGIAFASGAPILSGIIAGIVGGLVVSSISRSPLSVSGPAAGLTVIVASSIAELGSYQAFLLTLLIAGMLQVLFGYIKAGIIGSFFPSSVIKGMLASIGIILVLKQIPHALGYDLDYEGDFEFFQPDKNNTFTEIYEAYLRITPGAFVISAISLTVLILWDKFNMTKKTFVHGSFVAVVLGVLLNILFSVYIPSLRVMEEHLVQLISTKGFSSFSQNFMLPDFSMLGKTAVYLIAFKLAVIASLESLLSVDAIDKLDPMRRYTPKNHELKAQGIGNMVSALIGGLPITSVVVRSSANVDAGAKSKLSAIFHGLFLLCAVVLIPGIINMIPLSALAAILMLVGYKLAKVSLVKELYKKGWEHFLPFIITIFAVLFTDLLLGIGIGTLVALFFILRRNVLNPYVYNKQDSNYGVKVRIDLSEEVSFLNKASILYKLSKIPKNAHVVIDGSKSKFIDDDIVEIIEDFKINAPSKNIKIEIIDVDDKYELIENEELDKIIQQDYDKLFVNNRDWVKEKLAQDPTYFEKLALGQAPKYLFIGCSDSRITANEITGTDAGEMFIHRNIANLVVDTDLNLMAVLQYSIEVLKVHHVIVCGHYGCGGVKAAIDGKYHGLIDKWLRNIKKVYRLHYKELDDLLDEEKKHRKLVELVVREQVYNLAMTTIYQKALKQGQNIQLHGWVYDISEGYLRDLNIDVKKEFKEYELFKYRFEQG
ncbi:MAG TPA: SulP family inorganic anion transporter [Cytophagaceae bacterium]|nr:SulP family inorganic anion transporter [Cytophagaceae bacterium]